MRVLGKDIAIRPLILRRLRKLPSRPYAMISHLLYHGELTTFRNPKTFTQHLVHRKLYDHNPLYQLTADKYLARAYVAQKVGEEYLVPLLQVADNPEELKLEELEPPFVIKCTHGYSMNIFITDKSKVDRPLITKTTRSWLNANHFENWHEWAYKDCQPRLTVERFIGIGDQPPPDFKFWTIRGKVQIIQYDSDRYIKHRNNILDRNWTPLDVHTLFPNADTPARPKNLDQMIELAETLAEDFKDFVRVDLYNIDGKIYFGEFTHYPGGGCVRWNPKSFDLALGRMWKDGSDLPPDFVIADLREPDTVSKTDISSNPR